jgi:hypothetical protein
MMKLTHNSSLQERPKTINARSVDIAAHVFALSMPHGLVVVILIQQSVAGMLISGDKGNIVCNRRANKAIKCTGVGILDDLGDNHSLTGDSADHSDFASGATSQLAAQELVFVLFLTTDKSLIDFDFASEGRNVIALHGCAPAHAHIPTSAIVRAGIFTEDHAMNLQRANALLANEHEIADLEPKFQRFFGILKNGVSENRKAVAILTAATGRLAEPVKRASLKSINAFVATARTVNASWPAHFNQELFARLFGRKLLVKGINCFHGSKVADLCAGVNRNIIAFAKGGNEGDFLAQFDKSPLALLFPRGHRLEHADRKLLE